MNKLGISIAAVLVLGGSFLALAQHDQSQDATKAHDMSSPSMAMCKQMMADQKKSMAHMKTMDTKLDNLVAKMGRSTGTNKVNATSAVVKELVVQRKHMHTMMMGSNSKMMGHSMQHMSAGNMADCPMMKGMKGSSGGGK